jgi:hypothetical protein
VERISPPEITLIMSRKRIWTVVLSVIVFSAAYLFYVKKEREMAIKKYLPQPQLGDIYKMQKATRGGVTVFYLKVKDIGTQSIYFYPGLSSATTANDIFLKNFDTTETEVFSRKELMAIAAGEWDVPDRDRTKLIEIERK